MFTKNIDGKDKVILESLQRTDRSQQCKRIFSCWYCISFSGL